MTDLFVTPEATLLYHHLDEMYVHPKFPKSDPKYSAMLLINPAEDLQAWQSFSQYYTSAIKERVPGPIPFDWNAGVIEAERRFPAHADAWAQQFVVNTNNKFTAPNVFLNPTTRLDDVESIKKHFYTGCRVRAHVAVYVYPMEGAAKGFTFDLEGIIKVADGPRISLSDRPDVDSAGAFAAAGVEGVTGDQSFL